MTDTNKLSDAIDKLYNLNANISAVTYIHKQNPTIKTMQDINRLLGEIIKELREGVDELRAEERDNFKKILNKHGELQCWEDHDCLAEMTKEVDDV